MRAAAISGGEAKAAKSPHELFLINLIFNHIFLFIATVSAPSLQLLMLVVPIVSVGILGFTFWRARRSLTIDPWFVRCHWQMAARRSVIFVAMWLFLGGVAGALYLIAGGHPTPQYYALGGVAFFPTMVSMLVLILMETEALQQAKEGKLPRWARERWAAPEAALAEG